MSAFDELFEKDIDDMSPLEAAVVFLYGTHPDDAKNAAEQFAAYERLFAAYERLAEAAKQVDPDKIIDFVNAAFGTNKAFAEATLDEMGIRKLAAALAEVKAIK